MSCSKRDPVNIFLVFRGDLNNGLSGIQVTDIIFHDSNVGRVLWTSLCSVRGSLSVGQACANFYIEHVWTYSIKLLLQVTVL